MFNKQIKILFVITIILVNLSLTLHHVRAESTTEQNSDQLKLTPDIILQLNNSIAKINNQDVTLEVAPTLINNTTMVPLRFISEALGAKVSWNDSNKSISITNNNSKTIELFIDQSNANMDGKLVALDQPAIIIKENTIVPIRFIAESFDKKVSFDSAKGTIIITNAGNDMPAPSVVQKKLDKITVDNLTEPWEVGYKVTGYPSSPFVNPVIQQTKILDMVADESGNIFILEKEQDQNYRVLKYDPKESGFSLAVSVDNEFKISIKNNNKEETIMSLDLLPTKLYYNKSDNSLYLKCESNTSVKSIIFKVIPEVKMITYQDTLDTMSWKNDFLISSNAKDFYYSNLFKGKIFKGGEGTKSEIYTTIDFDPSDNLVPLVKQEIIYLLNTNKKTIYRLDASGVNPVTNVDIEDEILWATSQNGLFYFSTINGIYEIDLKGTLLRYMQLNNISYNSGLYNPKTKEYKNNFNNKEKDLGSSFIQFEPGKISFSKSTPFVVDKAGNVFLFDISILRRVNLFQ